MQTPSLETVLAGYPFLRDPRSSLVQVRAGCAADVTFATGRA